MSRYTLPLAGCTAELAGLVGGKAVGIGHLLREALDVPPGFVVTTAPYREWIAERGLERLLRLGDEAASREIQALLEAAEPPAALAADVALAYAALGGGSDALVAVRSSATAEDGASASFAGQQESYLGVTGLEPVLRHVVRCWASLFSPHAISYRRRLDLPGDQVAMAVVVQRLVEAVVSGVMLTIDPVNGDRSQVAIEATFGLGQPLVGGELTPDHYAVDKVTLEVRSRAVSHKPFADVYDRAAGAVRRVELTDDRGRAPCLDDGEVRRLAEVGRLTERALGGPVDMEWALGSGPDGPRHLYLLQARPETVWSARRAAPVAAPQTTPLDRMVSMMLGRKRP